MWGRGAGRERMRMPRKRFQLRQVVSPSPLFLSVFVCYIHVLWVGLWCYSARPFITSKLPVCPCLLFLSVCLSVFPSVCLSVLICIRPFVFLNSSLSSSAHFVCTCVSAYADVCESRHFKTSVALSQALHIIEQVCCRDGYRGFCYLPSIERSHSRFQGCSGMQL